ncbi:MAG: DNA polymerase III subunit epsilon [Gammaproteobacteria bacterium]|nr:DNA polymerase III subunit epsilon [Gammaproteobacteria bacterium]HBW82889.1 DNA polymerase III subunit epsilon [Gammaproteobacteria bacterium]|tara:strand:- start:10998 stop:11720 length:723 start_codon:yes stop_codon:yes gene_type:complete
MRQIVLDTETTGLDPKQGHRIIEIGCVEIENRRLTGRNFHCYLNPERDIDEAAIEVHGLTRQFLSDKPYFAQIEGEFLEFIERSELIIHNAPFDIGFLNNELALSSSGTQSIGNVCSVLDTLTLAKEKHPGQRNNLDALCKRYGVDNTQRDLHGALLDAEILADVYLVMTSGQSSLSLREDPIKAAVNLSKSRELDPARIPSRVIRASAAELREHEARLDEIDTKCDERSLWRRVENLQN